MPGEAVNFERDSAVRIGKATRWAEAQQISGPGPRNDDKPTAMASFDCVITDTGPDAEADFDDCRYWVRRVTLTTNSADETAKSEFGPFASTDKRDETWCATNRVEIEGDSHTLPVDRPVTVFYGYDKSTPPKPRFWFDAAPPAALPVRVQMDGGSAGSAATPPSWTYAIFSLFDPMLARPLATGVPVQRDNDYERDAAVEGTFGLAINAGGTWTLLLVAEKERTNDCTTGGGA